MSLFPAPNARLNEQKSQPNSSHQLNPDCTDQRSQHRILQDSLNHQLQEFFMQETRKDKPSCNCISSHENYNDRTQQIIRLLDLSRVNNINDFSTKISLLKRQIPERKYFLPTHSLCSCYKGKLYCPCQSGSDYMRSHETQRNCHPGECCMAWICCFPCIIIGTSWDYCHQFWFTYRTAGKDLLEIYGKYQRKLLFPNFD